MKTTYLALIAMLALASCGKNDPPPLCFIASTSTESFTYTDNRWTSGVKAGITYTIIRDNNRIAEFDYFDGKVITIAYNAAGKPLELITTTSKPFTQKPGKPGVRGSKKITRRRNQCG